MWRYISTVSEPKAKQTTAEKRKYFKDYDKDKRTRQFQSKWLTGRSWLTVDYADGMKCYLFYISLKE